MTGKLIIKTSEYKGKPLLTLQTSEDDRYPWSFGVRKAKMAYAAMDHIRAFIAKYDIPSSKDDEVDLD